MAPSRQSMTCFVFTDNEPDKEIVRLQEDVFLEGRKVRLGRDLSSPVLMA